MENSDMESLKEKNQQAENGSDFVTDLGRFRTAMRNGQEVEASVLQLKILAEHGVWVD